MDIDSKSAPAAPKVPGLTLIRLLGRGGHGEVWKARDIGSGEDVAVKLRRAPAAGNGRTTPADPDDELTAGVLAREVALLRRIDHPHVVRLRRMIDLPGGAGRALVLDLAAGGSLAALVASRGRLDPAEATTVIVPLSRALSDVHARGLVHGDLSPGNVLFASDGRPMIADLGSARVLGEQGAPTFATTGFSDPGRTAQPRPTDDVWALGALLRFALTGSADPADPAATTDPDDSIDPAERALLELADRCTDPDPLRRPDLAEIAADAWRAAPPSPIRLLTGASTASVLPSATASADASDDVTRQIRVDAALATARRQQQRPDPAGKSRRRNRLGRVAVVAVVAAAVSGLGGAVLLARGATVPAPAAAPAATAAPSPKAHPAPTSSATPPDTRSPAPKEPTPAQVVKRLAEVRAAAFGSASVATLARLDEPHSAAWEADAAFIKRLRSTGTRLRGLTFTVTEVRSYPGTGHTLIVSAMVATSAHLRVSNDGNTMTDVAAEPPQAVELTLVPAAGGWLIRAVR